MAFKFPFTNYHELNLTWVLDQLKKLFEESAENVSVIENYDGRLTAVETELPAVSENASEASRTAAAAASLAQTAKATADTAQENAIQAQRAAGTAQNTAECAQEAADAATQAAQQAQATALNFEGRITQAENDASQALEASRSFENRVQAAITTANNANQTATNAQGIAMRADQNAGTALDRAEAAQTAAATADEKAEDAQATAANIAESIAPVEETATASRSYAVNELLIYKNKLYKVASTIAAGGVLTPGSNIILTTIDAEIETSGSDKALSVVNFGNVPEAVNRLLFAPPTEISGRGMKVKTYYNAIDIYEVTATQIANIILTGTPRITSSSSSAPWFTPRDSDYSPVNVSLLRNIINGLSYVNSQWWGFYKNKTSNMNNECYITLRARYKKSDGTYVTDYANTLSNAKRFNTDIFINKIKNSITVDGETLYCSSICIHFRVYVDQPCFIGLDLLH